MCNMLIPIGPFQSTTGEMAKLKAKVCLNLHGIVSIESATVPTGDCHCVYSCKFFGFACESTSIPYESCSLLTDLFTCHVCEEKFQLDCIKDATSDDIDNEDPSFCGNECLEFLIYK